MKKVVKNHMALLLVRKNTIKTEGLVKMEMEMNATHPRTRKKAPNARTHIPFI